jgi:hypothetical protein
MQDIVIFQGVTYNLPQGHTEAEIRVALSEQAPAIAHAQMSRTQNADGTSTWEFTERAGTKG